MERWILGILTRILTVISPEIRVLFVGWIKDLEARAKATPNPWDDIFVAFLKMLINIETTEPADVVKPEGE